MADTDTKERDDGLRFYEVTVGGCGHNGGKEICKHLWIAEEFPSKPLLCLHPSFNQDRDRKVIHPNDYSGTTFPKFCPLGKESRYEDKKSEEDNRKMEELAYKFFKEAVACGGKLTPKNLESLLLDFYNRTDISLTSLNLFSSRLSKEIYGEDKGMFW